jgi:hypothetical protein
VITGAHVIVYSADAEPDRAFLLDLADHHPTAGAAVRWGSTNPGARSPRASVDDGTPDTHVGYWTDAADQTRTLRGPALSCSGDLPTPLQKLSSQLGAGATGSS